MLTNWITSSPYLKTHTTPEVCTPQPQHATYRTGGIHTHTHFGPLTTGGQWVLQGLTHMHPNCPNIHRQPPHTQPHGYLHQHASHSKVNTDNEWCNYQWCCITHKVGEDVKRTKCWHSKRRRVDFRHAHHQYSDQLMQFMNWRVRLHIAQCKHSHECDVIKFTSKG